MMDEKTVCSEPRASSFTFSHKFHAVFIPHVQRDPSTREPLTPDQLIPQPELKAQIKKWVFETIQTKRAEKAAAAAAAAAN